MSADDGIDVEIVYSARPREVSRALVRLHAGATVADALQVSGWLGTLLPAELEGLSLGVWGQRATAHDVLRQDDRVEVYRGLRVDPKEARRLRYRQHLERYPPKRGAKR